MSSSASTDANGREMEADKTIDVLCMNLSGRFKGREINLMGQFLIGSMLKEKRVDIFLGQHLNFELDLPEIYNVVGGSKSFIIYDATIYDILDDKDYRMKLKNLQMMGKVPHHYLPEKNFAICKLQSRLDEKMEFIAISWLSDDAQSDVKKASFVKKLGIFVSMLSKLEGIPVVVGGTFKLTNSMIVDALPDEVCYVMNEPINARRALRAYSSFVVTSNVLLEDIQTIVFGKFDIPISLKEALFTKRKEVWSDPEDVFYCDPVFATINLSPTTQARVTNGELRASQPKSRKQLYLSSSQTKDIYEDKDIMFNGNGHCPTIYKSSSLYNVSNEITDDLNNVLSCCVS